MSAKPQVSLLPWDASSAEHVQRMIEQRIACGWHAPAVTAEWQPGQLAGTKCIYWIIFPQDEPRRQELLDKHVEAYPKETEELEDTCTSLLQAPREATKAKFVPIGHIALDMHSPGYTKTIDLDLPKATSCWIKSLYVSYALQGLGIGRAAMYTAEAKAVVEPINAKHLLLDTLHPDDQMNEEFAIAHYGEVRKEATSAWYERRGYKFIGCFEDLYGVSDRTGKYWPTRTVFLHKQIA